MGDTITLGISISWPLSPRSRTTHPFLYISHLWLIPFPRQSLALAHFQISSISKEGKCAQTTRSHCAEWNLFWVSFITGSLNMHPHSSGMHTIVPNRQACYRLFDQDQVSKSFSTDPQLPNSGDLLPFESVANCLSYTRSAARQSELIVIAAVSEQGS